MPAGRLILVPTPIGNLDDISLRALATLRDADVIAAEDTRHTRKLLSHFDIHSRLVSYQEHNERRQLPYLLERVRAGETVAVVSDAGTPGIADPGQRLVAACLDAGLDVEALPGPSAVLTALVVSGLPTDSFLFAGWVPRTKKDREKLLERIDVAPQTVILYESPKRVAATLGELAGRLPDRRAVVARELTKLHEEVIRGTLDELARRVAEGGEVRGEIVLMIGPADLRASAPEPDAEALSAVEARTAAGESTRDAVRAVALERGLVRRALYAAVMAAKGGR